jgi:threonyl-tRNA synthetase
VQPDRFELRYTNDKGEEEMPLMVHSALLGSLERFLSVYIEHTNGWFPFWLAPEQIRILTINNEVGDYVEQITSKLKRVVLMSPLKYNELRFSVDERSESLGKKIRTAQNLKVPVMMIVGPRDKEAGTVGIRTQDGEQSIKLDELESFLANLK